MTQTICSLTVGLKWVVVDKWTRYGAIVSFDIITYTGLFWFQMVQVIYRRFWHILRIFFQYLYESRYFDHSCILCVVPYASEKFGQIWTKMIEEAMMRLFLRKKNYYREKFWQVQKIRTYIGHYTIRSQHIFFISLRHEYHSIAPLFGKKKFENDLQFWNYFQIIVYFQDRKEWWHGWWSISVNMP